ncbi:hypothetical protein AB0P21_37745 [Kribbella sp. NPDC056861]|uniref:hypothetical protein n=1 Tax=Kribbella sp. NPDC056861 TaxID=3154857 RepID=UPI003449845E
MGKIVRVRRLAVRPVRALLLGGSVAPVDFWGFGTAVIAAQVNLLGGDDCHQSVDRHA